MSSTWIPAGAATRAAPEGALLGGLLGGGAAGGILSGGLGDLLKQFQQNGQGDKAQSWISSGPNKAVSPRELEEALGPDKIAWLMQQTGQRRGSSRPLRSRAAAALALRARAHTRFLTLQIPLQLFRSTTAAPPSVQLVG